MFDTLSSSLQRIFRNLRGYGKLTEANVAEALREVRLALLEADVNFQVARDFVARVKAQCVGEEVLGGGITPGQQVIKRIHDELVALLGSGRRDFDFSGRPAVVLLLGLHGAGKTTTAAKLALRWKAEGRKVLLAACDLKRPAAVDQLRILAGQTGVDCVVPEPGDDVPGVGRRALKKGENELYDALILDTGGRFQIDAELVGELKELRDAVRPRNVVLVLDAAIGQESVNVAQTFQREVGLTGLILTKLDGDARGGAALSVHAVTGCPILLVGTGEKAENLEPFHPDRMASRILGMGDIVSLVEKAQASVTAEDIENLQAVARKRQLDLNDFLGQIRQMRKMGPIENILEMIPGLGRLPDSVRDTLQTRSGDDMKRTEAIILSMTPRERRNPDLINGSRRARIARGSGSHVSDVNDLLRKFEQMRKMMKRMKKAGRRFSPPGGGGPPMPGLMPGAPPG